MARPSIKNIKLNEYLTLSECHPDSESIGKENDWWVYDTRASRNICMRAKSVNEAMTKAVEYWAKRALKTEAEYAQIKSTVDMFVNRFSDSDSEA